MEKKDKKEKKEKKEREITSNCCCYPLALIRYT